MANLASRLFDPCLGAYRRFLKPFGLVHSVCYGAGNGILNLTAWATGFRTNPDDPLSWRLALTTGSYEPETSKLFARIIRHGMAVVDVGAHVGYYTTQFSRLVGSSGRVIAFEPQPRNHAILQRNIAGRSNVTLLQNAASDRQETVALFDDMPDTGGASLRRDDRRTGLMRGLTSADDLAPRAHMSSLGDQVEVAAVRIDEALASLGITEVDVVKMDIEGAEMGALKGMENILQTSPRLSIVLEFNPVALRPFGVEPAKLCSWLADRGFELSWIAGDGSLETLADEAAARTLAAELEQSAAHVNLFARRR